MSHHPLRPESPEIPNQRIQRRFSDFSLRTNLPRPTADIFSPPVDIDRSTQPQTWEKSTDLSPVLVKSSLRPPRYEKIPSGRILGRHVGNEEKSRVIHGLRIDIVHRNMEELRSLTILRTQVEPQEKKKTPKGRAKKRLTYTRRFVNVTLTGGKRKVWQLTHE